MSIADDVSSPKIAREGHLVRLDPDNLEHQGAVRQAIRRWPKRWRGISDTAKDDFVTGLHKAAKTATTLLDSQDDQVRLNAASAMSSIARTAAAMEGQNQTDEWNQDKNNRLDAGLATERIGTEPVVIEQAIEPPAKQIEGK